MHAENEGVFTQRENGLRRGGNGELVTPQVTIPKLPIKKGTCLLVLFLKGERGEKIRLESMTMCGLGLMLWGGQDGEFGNKDRKALDIRKIL